MRRRVGQVQTLIKHDESFESIECKRPIGHLLNTIFAECPSPQDLVLNSDNVFNELSPREQALFFTERLPVRRQPRFGQFNYIEEENDPSFSPSDFSQDALFNECIGDRPMSSVKRRGGSKNNGLGSLESVPPWVQDYLPRQDLPTNRESRSKDMPDVEMPDVAELTQIVDDKGPMS